MTTEAQIRHIELHQAEFDEHQGGPANVREYFHDSSDPDIYFYLCSDLEIEPIKGPAVPLQEMLGALKCSFPTIVCTFDDEGNDVVCAKERDGSWTVSPGRPR